MEEEEEVCRKQPPFDRDGCWKGPCGRNDDSESQSVSFCSTTSTDFTTSSDTATTNSTATAKPHKTCTDLTWEAVSRLRSVAGSPLSLENFRFFRRLGGGDIGTVYLAELKDVPGTYVAVKVMDKNELVTRNKSARAKTEREILELLDHPFLPTLYAHLECEKWTCLVTEFCPGGDLHVLRQLQPAKRFPESAVRFYAAEVVVALEYIHMMGIVYRDLKPENVLVREDGHIMLTDFDLSLKSDQPTCTALLRPDQIPPDPDASALSGRFGSDRVPGSCILPNCMAPAVSCFRLGRRRRRKWKSGGSATSTMPELLAEPVDARSMSFVGTHEYLAPEIIAGDGHGNAVDWWTLGVFVYELLYGRTPFKGPDHESTLANIVARALDFPRQPHASAAVRDLIARLLVKDPDRRMGSTRGAAQVKQHPFFHGVNWALLRCGAPPNIPPPFDRATDVADEFYDDGSSSPVDFY
ncbi:unnamed protein product [Victoria cruziana]